LGQARTLTVAAANRGLKYYSARLCENAVLW